jgi:hypothetical protein
MNNNFKFFWLWWFLGICHYGTWKGFVATAVAFAFLVADFLTSDIFKSFIKGLRGK